MIVVEAVSGLLDLLTALLGAIPDLTLPFGDYPEDFAVEIGGALGGLDGVVPISESAVVAGWALTAYLPVAVSFQITRWVYTHLPVVGNGG